MPSETAVEKVEKLEKWEWEVSDDKTIEDQAITTLREYIEINGNILSERSEEDVRRAWHKRRGFVDLGLWEGGDRMIDRLDLFCPLDAPRGMVALVAESNYKIMQSGGKYGQRYSNDASELLTQIIFQVTGGKWYVES